MSQLLANVMDFDAVPDGEYDCSDAFQRAVDSLDSAHGGTVFVPAAEKPYAFHRSVLVDRNNVRIVGDHPATTVLLSKRATPPFIFGVQRTPGGRPMDKGHWADLYGLLDSTAAAQPGKRWGIRTRVPSPADGGAVSDTTVTFPCSPFQLGPPDSGFWSGVQQLTVDFLVRNNAMPWAGQPLFGMVDKYSQPSPFYAHMAMEGRPPHVAFHFRTTDGLHRVIRIPFKDYAQPDLRCSIQLDLAAGTVAAWTNHEQVTPDLSQINDRWDPDERGKKPLEFVANWYAPFNVGTLTYLSSGKGGSLGIPTGPADLTFGALRFSDITRYRDTAGQDDADGPVTDLTWLTPQPGVFGHLPMSDPVHTDAAGAPDLQFMWQTGGAGGFGIFVPLGLSSAHTVSRNTLEKLNVTCFNGLGGTYGQAIGLGLVYDFVLDDCMVAYGAQGLSSYNFGANYTVNVRSSTFIGQRDCGIYSFFQTGYGDDLHFSSLGRSAVKTLLSKMA